MKRLSLSAALLLVCGCSFTTATGFNECTQDSECEGGQVCKEHYCVGNTVPPGCGETYGAVDDANALHFGAALPITPSTGTDQSEVAGLNAIKLAVDEINQRAIALGGHAIALHICDTKAEKDLVKTDATWLIDDQKVVAIITSGSGQTLAASEVTIPRNVVLMSATSTSPEITALPKGPPRLVWRTAPSDAIQGKAIAKVIATDSKFTSVNKVGVIYLNDPYGQGLKDVLVTSIASPRTVQSFLYERGGDVTAAVNGLNSFNPDLTVLIGFPDDAVKIIQQGINLPSSNLTVSSNHQWFFTDSAKDPALMQGLGSNAAQIDGSYGTAPAQGAGLAYATFKDAYQSKYQVDPATYAFTSHSYDAMYTLALGAVWSMKGGAAVSGAGIAEGLAQLSSGTSYRLSATQFTAAASDLSSGKSVNVDGASGKLDFDATVGEAPSPIELWKVTGSTFTTQSTIEP